MNVWIMGEIIMDGWMNNVSNNHLWMNNVSNNSDWINVSNNSEWMNE